MVISLVVLHANCKSTIANWTISIQESSEDPRFRSTVIGVEAKKLEVFPTVFSGGCHLFKLLQHLQLYNRRISELLYWCTFEMVVKTNMILHSCLQPACTRVPKTRGAQQSETPKHDSVLMPTLAYAATRKQTLIRILDPIISRSGSSAWG